MRSTRWTKYWSSMVDKEEFERRMRQMGLRCHWPGGFKGMEVRYVDSVNVENMSEPQYGVRGLRGFARGEVVVDAVFCSLYDGVVHRFAARWSDSNPTNWYLKGHEMDMSPQHGGTGFDIYNEPLTTAAKRRAKHKAPPEPKVNVQAEAASFEAAAKFLEDDT